MGTIKKKQKTKARGQIKGLSSDKPVWIGKSKDTNITRLMTAGEALEWSKKTGQPVFTKMKKYELDLL
jgi:hypothetical protein